MFLDSHILLQDSKRLLDEIEQLYSDALGQQEVPPILRVRVKQFLDNVNSSLEYAAFDIFTKYCADHVKQLKPNQKDFERHEGSIYFPVWDYKPKFDTYIDTKFVKLREEHPNIVKVFEKYQPFPTRSKWLRHLKDLVNTNKHRNLTKQLPMEMLNVVNGMRIVDGVVTSFDGSIELAIFFDETGQPVLRTLKRIYASAPTVIKDLEQIL